MEKEQKLVADIVARMQEHITGDDEITTSKLLLAISKAVQLCEYLSKDVTGARKKAIVMSSLEVLIHQIQDPCIRSQCILVFQTMGSELVDALVDAAKSKAFKRDLFACFRCCR